MSNLTRGCSNPRFLSLQNRYSRQSAMSVFKPKQIPKCLKNQKAVLSRTPILAPLAPFQSQTLPAVELIGDGQDKYDVNKKIILVRKEQPPHVREAEFIIFPPFGAIDPDTIQDMISRKIDVCTTVMCDFSAEEYDQPAKRAKQECLLEIRSLFDHPHLVKYVNYVHLRELIHMVEVHLDFERLPIKMTLKSDDWNTLHFYDPAWPHLSIIYQILTVLVQMYKTQVKISEELLRRLMELLRSPDVRERESLTVFFTTYLRVFAENRSRVVRSLLGMIFDYIEQLDEPFCVQPVLQIWKAFPRYFNECLNDPFLLLFSLCASPHVPVYFSLVVPIIDEMTERQPELRYRVMKCLVNRFPIHPVKNQIVRILMIGNVLQNLTVSEFDDIKASLLKLMHRCAASDCAQVAQASFNLWNNPKVKKLFQRASKEIISDLYPLISYSMKNHWNVNVRGSAMFVLKAMQSMDAGHFEFMHKQSKTIPLAGISSSKTRTNWNRILQMASTQYKDIEDVMLEESEKINEIFKTARSESENYRSSDVTLLKPFVL